MRSIQILMLMFAWLSGVQSVQAQEDYETAVGVRFGLSNGVTIRHFMNSSTAVEGIAAFRWRGLVVTGLYEKHKALPTEGLGWFYGGGGHIGFWNGDVNPWFVEDRSYIVIGVDFIVGLDYTFSSEPINISLDWKPALNLIGYQGLWGGSGGLSVRYILD